MEINTWEKVESIFHIAVELPFEERNPYLQNECAGNGELFSEVESLIESFEKDSHILDEPVFELGLDAIGKKSQKNLANSTIGFYKLEEKIGAGGMGEVYKAVDTRLNRRVALKFLSATLENDNSAKRQFIKEAQAVAMLEHPNICAVHGIEETGEHHFIVMQYIEGKTLGESFKDTPIGVEDFKSVTRQILTAVAFAHSHGVIHRDLKPGNIMLTDDGHIKVLDFGLAKIIPQNRLLGSKTGEEVSQFSSSGLVIGTVSYMSPEQLRGKKLDYRSDIFSIGIVLYELLARQNPFNCESQAEVIAAILSTEPPNVKEFSANFPVPLVKLVEKCLHKNPDDRFQSAAEMLVELDTAETANVGWKNSKHRSNLWLKAMVAAVILFTVLAFIFFSNSKTPRRTLAVMPVTFDNTQAEKKYLADGLTASFIEELSGLSELKVKNEYSVNRFKEKNIEPAKIGKELNADAVLVGSIIERNGSLALVTRLIRTSDGFVIDPYEFPINEANLVELQEKVAARILDKIRLEINAEDKNKLAKKDTDSEDAKRLYLQGRFLLKTRKDGDDLEKAIQCFTDAKDFDANYAKAWTGLADAYLLKSLPGAKNPITPKKAVELAKPAAERALKLDNTLSETYTSLGLINSRYEWNWKEAESNFRSAIYLDDEFIPAHLGLIGVLNFQGRFDESLLEAKKIKEFDAVSIVADLEIAKIYYRKKEFAQTDKILSDLLERNPDHKALKYVRGYQLINTGRFNEAIEILRNIYESGNEEDKIYAAAPLGFACAKAGRFDEARKIIANLELSEKTGYVPAQEKALIYVGLGNYDKVFENLNKSCTEKFPTLPGWITDPITDDVKADPKFVEIRKCVNL